MGWPTAEFGCPKASLVDQGMTPSTPPPPPLPSAEFRCPKASLVDPGVDPPLSLDVLEQV